MSEFLGVRSEELSLDPEREKLIDQLVDIEGEKIGKSIIWRLLFDPEINRVFFMGAPGSGKSTLLGQMVDCIERLAVALKVPLVESITLYEDELYAVEENKRDTLEFNEYFLEAILNPRRTRVVYPGEHPKLVNFVESPSVGKTFIRDRGVTAFERLVRVETSTLFVNIIPHPVSQMKGVAIRTDIPLVPDERVSRVLAEKFKVIVSGIDLPAQLVGRKVKSILRRNALAHHMRAINLELEEQLREWFLTDPSANKGKNLVKVPTEYSSEMIYRLRCQFYEETYGEEVLPSMGVIAESLQIQAVRDWARVEAAFAKYRFENLGLDKDRWGVAFNRFFSGPIIWRIT